MNWKIRTEHEKQMGPDEGRGKQRRDRNIITKSDYSLGIGRTALNTRCTKCGGARPPSSLDGAHTMKELPEVGQLE